MGHLKLVMEMTFGNSKHFLSIDWAVGRDQFCNLSIMFQQGSNKIIDTPQTCLVLKAVS